VGRCSALKLGLTLGTSTRKNRIAGKIDYRRRRTVTIPEGEVGKLFTKRLRICARGKDQPQPSYHKQDESRKTMNAVDADLRGLGVYSTTRRVIPFSVDSDAGDKPKRGSGCVGFPYSKVKSGFLAGLSSNF
jgi:hypothetical protein